MRINLNKDEMQIIQKLKEKTFREGYGRNKYKTKIDPQWMIFEASFNLGALAMYQYIIDKERRGKK